MPVEYGAIDDTFYFHFAANDTSGSGGDGASPACDVRLCGAAAAAAPVYSPTPVLLTDGGYPDGAHEVAIVASAGNGFAAGNTYAVFCTLLVDSQNPTGFVGKFTLDRQQVDMVQVEGSDATTALEAAAQAVIVANNLDHLAKVADNDDVADNSILAHLASSTGNWSTFDDATDSQEAIADALTVAGVSYFPDASSVVTTGDQGATTFADCAADDGVKWTIGDENGAYTIDVICEMNMGAGRIGAGLDVNGYYSRSGAGGYRCEVYAYNYTLSDWDKISGGTPGTELFNRGSDADYVFALSEPHTDHVTTPGEVKIRFRSTRETTAAGDVLYLDVVRLTGQGSNATSPSVFAQAVWIHEDGRSIRHIPKFTGDTWYVSASDGSDTLNSGAQPKHALATVGAAIAAAKAGDQIVTHADTYTEAGLDLNLDGLELHCEIGTEFTGGGSGTALVVSADHCKVLGLDVIPGAGQIGLQVTGDDSFIEDCRSHGSGGTAYQVSTAGTGNQFVSCVARDYTVTGFDIQGPQNTFRQCFADGSTGTTRGFYLSNAAADHNLFDDCSSVDNSTAGWEVVADADNNLFQVCSDSEGCGALVDSGTDNSWRGFMTTTTLTSADVVTAMLATTGWDSSATMTFGDAIEGMWAVTCGNVARTGDIYVYDLPDDGTTGITLTVASGTRTRS